MNCPALNLAKQSNQGPSERGRSHLYSLTIFKGVWRKIIRKIHPDVFYYICQGLSFFNQHPNLNVKELLSVGFLVIFERQRLIQHIFPDDIKASVYNHRVIQVEYLLPDIFSPFFSVNRYNLDLAIQTHYCYSCYSCFSDF